MQLLEVDVEKRISIEEAIVILKNIGEDNVNQINLHEHIMKLKENILNNPSEIGLNSNIQNVNKLYIGSKVSD